jgi:hypothetical protein
MAQPQQMCRLSLCQCGEAGNQGFPLWVYERHVVFLQSSYNVSWFSFPEDTAQYISNFFSDFAETQHNQSNRTQSIFDAQEATSSLTSLQQTSNKMLPGCCPRSWLGKVMMNCASLSGTLPLGLVIQRSSM